MTMRRDTKRKRSRDRRRAAGFTLVEVIIAGTIMIILCVGTLTTFSYAVKINAGNNLRSQAQSVLQQEAEYYRSLKFVPSGADADMDAGTHNRPNRTSADGTAFTMTADVTNLPLWDGTASTNTTATMKEITITATPVNAQAGWLANLHTTLTIQRVRAN